MVFYSFKYQDPFYVQFAVSDMDGNGRSGDKWSEKKRDKTRYNLDVVLRRTAWVNAMV